ncbi:MAG: glucuronate isomerase [Lachnospiraceae bacterium]|nr:glucuronate isomerase [Lachnospiraceae bacterium]
MKKFMDNDFLLNNETAKTLYHDFAKQMPVIDYHCHINPQEIAANRRYTNITQVWLEADHYKWRLMRANGEDEKYVTGNKITNLSKASNEVPAPKINDTSLSNNTTHDYEKFLAFAKIMPKAIGNPVYHWAHLELKRYFDCDLALSEQNAKEIWDICNQKLNSADMSVRGIIEKSKVEVIVTTDDPVDSLEWHKAIKDDPSFTAKVLPGFRPDKAVNIEKADFGDYIKQLSAVCQMPINSIDDLFSALENRLDFFAQLGAVTADHGLDYIPYARNAENDTPVIFSKALAGTLLSDFEVQQYKTALLLFFGRQYAKRGFIMQLHYGALRNNNQQKMALTGPDSGYDAISSFECSHNIAAFLNELEKTNELPKTILYSLNPNDDAMLQTIAACFPGQGILGKVQQGSAWWFNDTKPGMEAQLTNLASRGLLGGFVGMLTDSRSFLSYTRHEYFRRILCNMVGLWAEKGECPNDIEVLGKLVSDVSYNNVKAYFGF